jgi:2-oxoglutarate ferredoxin oxidoreductase subunit beta
LSRLSFPEFPVPVGIFRNVKRQVYHEGVAKQIEMAQAKGAGNLEKLFNSGNPWVVE